MKKEIEKLKARIEELVRIADAEYERRVKAEAELARRDALEPAGYLVGHRLVENMTQAIAYAEGTQLVIEPLFTAAPAPVVRDDYFASLVLKARESADKAMTKFPQPNYVLLKVAEEAGEVVQAGVHYAENRMSWDDVESEIVQLLAMLMRLVVEGDQVNGIVPPEHCRAAMLKGRA